MKFLKFIAILLVLAVAAYVGYSYFLNPSVPSGHQHEASADWSNDETDHWHVCTGEGCEEILDKAAHVYEDEFDKSCNECGEEREVPHRINITGGTADKTSAFVGETVTLTPNDPEEGQMFSHWTLNGSKIEGNSFTMPNKTAVVKAVFVDTHVVLETPNNSEGKAIYAESATAIAIDRMDTTMFVNGVADVMFYIYTSPDAAKDAYVGRFIMSGESKGQYITGISTCFRTLDGVEYRIIQGLDGDYWTTDINAFYSMLQHILGYDYSDGQKYYYAVQLLAEEDTEFIEYRDSDISAIGPNGFARDESKGADKYTITVENGLIDGEYTTITAGYGNVVTLSTNPIDGYNFAGWYVVDANGEATGSVLSSDLSFSYTVSGNATLIPVFSQNKIKLDTYDNSGSKALYAESASAIAMDRLGTTFFGTGVADVMFYVYTSPDADKDAYVGRFIMSGESKGQSISGISTCFRTLDGTEYRIIQGLDGNYWTTDINAFYSMLKHILGYEYSDGQKYYYAVQLLAEEGTIYEDSDISAIGANGFARDESKGTEKYTITVENGTIGGSLTSVSAGYGAIINLKAIMPEGKEFGYWTYVIYNEDGSETLGNIVSSDSEVAYTVTSSIILRAVEMPAERIKLDAPSNANNEMFKVVTGTAFTEYDRQKNEDGSAKTAFTDGVARVRFYMYADVTINGATERVIVSWFDMDKDGYMYDYNGNKTMGGNGGKCQGTPGNWWGDSGEWHNFIKACFDQGAIAQGYDIRITDTTFYIACQSITENPLYENSEIGSMGQGWKNI